MQLRLATANVLSLDPTADFRATPSARRQQLAADLHKLKVDVAGLQESRVKGDRAQKVGQYFMVATGGAKGTLGVEIWFHSRLAVTEQNCWRVISEPRLLVLRTRLGQEECLVTSGHAPHDKPEWWKEFPQRIEQCNVDKLPVVLLTDANARVGSEQSQAIGPEGSEQQNEMGAAFHEALLQLQLVAANAFLGNRAHCHLDAQWRADVPPGLCGSAKQLAGRMWQGRGRPDRHFSDGRLPGPQAGHYDSSEAAEAGGTEGRAAAESHL